MNTVFSVEIAAGIHLHINKTTLTWEEFCQTAPPCSIALDGYVYGKYRYSESGPYMNINHHEEVDRLPTRSTCGQVLMYIKQGLMEVFANSENEPCVNLFVNDCDQDVCSAVWLFQHHPRFKAPKSEPLVNRLIAVEEKMDATGGAYPLDPNSKVMREMAWIFEPYTVIKSSGLLPSLAPTDYAEVIHEVGERISQYASGAGDTRKLDTRYQIIGGGERWRLVREIGEHAITGIYHSGINAFVSVRKSGGQRFHYSIGRVAPFIPFPIPELYTMLNEVEGLVSGSARSWGGSDTIGGSPRVIGSTLSPAELETLINEFLKSKIQKR